MTVLALCLGLSACANLGPAPALTWLDLGPSPVAAPSRANGPAITLAAVDAPPALEGTAVGYRLLYAQAQAPRAYAQARWTMPPAALLRERLKARLGQDRPVLQPGDQASAPVLRLELEEFGQAFDSPQASRGVLRLRATLTRSGGLLGQRVLLADRPAPSADSAGGAAALALASDALAEELAAWVTQALAAR
jgi:cholesterol transport system auxiliary component